MKIFSDNDHFVFPHDYMSAVLFCNRITRIKPKQLSRIHPIITIYYTHPASGKLHEIIGMAQSENRKQSETVRRFYRSQLP